MTQIENQSPIPAKKPNYLARRAGALVAAAVLALGAEKAIESVTDQPTGDRQEQTDVNRYSITSPPAEVGEGTDDLVQKVFPNANELPEGVIQVDQLGVDDSILGEGERIKVSVPDEESFITASGLDAPTGPPTETPASGTDNRGIVEGPK